MKVICVHEDVREYPTTDVYLVIEGQAYLVTVGVAKELPYLIILGQDLPVTMDLLSQIKSCNAVVTRMQARQTREEINHLESMPFLQQELRTSQERLISPRV